MNSTIDNFIGELETHLPKRQKPKIGRSPIPRNVILIELYKLFKTNCGWRNIKHRKVCYQYLKEIQRRGPLLKFFNSITEHLVKGRPPKSIVDSSDIVSYRVKP